MFASGSLGRRRSGYWLLFGCYPFQGAFFLAMGCFFELWCASGISFLAKTGCSRMYSSDDSGSLEDEDGVGKPLTLQDGNLAGYLTFSSLTPKKTTSSPEESSDDGCWVGRDQWGPANLDGRGVEANAVKLGGALFMDTIPDGGPGLSTWILSRAQSFCCAPRGLRGPLTDVVLCVGSEFDPRPCHVEDALFRGTEWSFWPDHTDISESDDDDAGVGNFKWLREDASGLINGESTCYVAM